MITIRGAIFSPLSDPFAAGSAGSYRWHEDGFITVDGSGIITGIGDWQDRTETTAFRQLPEGSILVPGLVDTHLHAPQLEMIGSYGGHLLQWLETYTFPTEIRFADEEHAKEIAEVLFLELAKNGTTSSLIFSTIHTGATRAFFEAAERVGTRAIIGKTMMDRNAPAELLEDAGFAYEESIALIEEWSGRNPLLGYAVTPRFAPTSTPQLLEAAGELLERWPDLWVHTHISENVPEVRWVSQLFPEESSYAAVYDRYGLLRKRTVLAHGVHLSEEELNLLAARGAAIAHCPNSNLFLGSGLFPLKKVQEHGVRIGLGSDIGAGTTPSIISAMSDAYKVQRVRGISLDPFELFYLATLSGAAALGIDDRTGSLEVGKSADYVILDLRATRLLALRTERARSLEDLLAGIIFMGDDRLVMETVVAGRTIWTR